MVAAWCVGFVVRTFVVIDVVDGSALVVASGVSFGVVIVIAVSVVAV